MRDSKSKAMPYTFTIYYTDFSGLIRPLTITDSSNQDCLETASLLWDTLAKQYKMISTRPIYKGN